MWRLAPSLWRKLTSQRRINGASNAMWQQLLAGIIMWP